MTSSSKLPEILKRHESDILNDWMRYQLSSTTVRGNLIRENELREQSRAFLGTLREALESGSGTDLDNASWGGAREFVTEMARTRARQGFTPVETVVAQHLLKTVAAARLMGADCIISGVRPQIAQTIVHLGVELGDVTTKATLADAFRLALRRSGQSIAKA